MGSFCQDEVVGDADGPVHVHGVLPCSADVEGVECSARRRSSLAVAFTVRLLLPLPALIVVRVVAPSAIDDERIAARIRGGLGVDEEIIDVFVINRYLRMPRGSSRSRCCW